MPANLHFRVDRRVWEIRFSQLGAEWKQTIGTDKAVALAAVKLANERIDKGEDMRPARLRPATVPGTATAADTVAVFGRRWLVDGWAGRKMSTNKAYEKNFRLYVAPAPFGDTPLAKLTRPACVAFLKSLLTKRGKSGRLLKHKSREGIYLALSALLSAAVEAELIPANPAARLAKKLVSPDEVPDPIVVFRPEQADRFLETVRTRRPDWYAFFFVALRTGLRIGELIELRWDLDFEVPHAIHVQRAYVMNKRTTAALGADGRIAFETVEGIDQISSPKGKRTRYVETSDEVERVLARHRIEQKAVALKRGRPAPSLVFPTPLHGKRINPRNLRADILAPMIKAARVPAIDVHGLRHTFASILLSRGERLDFVSRQLGHANQSTTERVYRHWIPDNAAEVAARRARLDHAWTVDKTEGGE